LNADPWGHVPSFGPKSEDALLEGLLKQKRDVILEKWQNLILETYPEDSRAFLKNQRDRFQNPVGNTLRDATTVLLEALIEGVGTEALSSSMDDMIRVRSVQDFPPSQAVVPIFLLKNVVREELMGKLGDSILCEELFEFESKIDGLALSAFDNYMKCKTEIYDIRAREAQKMSAKLLERLNRSTDEMDRLDSSLEKNT
jgi:hypothetical protein